MSEVMMMMMLFFFPEKKIFLGFLRPLGEQRKVGVRLFNGKKDMSFDQLICRTE